MNSLSKAGAAAFTTCVLLGTLGLPAGGPGEYWKNAGAVPVSVFIRAAEVADDDLMRSVTEAVPKPSPALVPVEKLMRMGKNTVLADLTRLGGIRTGLPLEQAIGSIADLVHKKMRQRFILRILFGW